MLIFYEYTCLQLTGTSIIKHTNNPFLIDLTPLGPSNAVLAFCIFLLLASRRSTIKWTIFRMIQVMRKEKKTIPDVFLEANKISTTPIP
jgi:hypothetical protein